jgi:hypothetical protein
MQLLQSRIREFENFEIRRKLTGLWRVRTTKDRLAENYIALYRQS